MPHLTEHESPEGSDRPVHATQPTATYIAGGTGCHSDTQLFSPERTRLGPSHIFWNLMGRAKLGSSLGKYTAASGKAERTCGC